MTTGASQSFNNVTSWVPGLDSRIQWKLTQNVGFGPGRFISLKPKLPSSHLCKRVEFNALEYLCRSKFGHRGSCSLIGNICGIILEVIHRIIGRALYVDRARHNPNH